ncbi:MAG: RNA polymerase sigma factor [Polyangiaceae bacterium]|nr:RNA polymerase sigma factor [Polyangiaceae bacterium]
MSDARGRAALEAAYRNDARRVRATLIRLLGSFEAAEDALHDAFAAAADAWPRDGVPHNPYSWLVSAGRFKAIDRIRRAARVEGSLPTLAALSEETVELEMPGQIRDDELRLIFTCCHPALEPDARIALTLREVAGLTTEEIARAYIVPAPTIGQRIVRAKAKIKNDRIPYAVPDHAELPNRLGSVLSVIYLVFNEGYGATKGPDLLRHELCAEAIRLGRLVVELTDDPEALGVLALMLLHDARHDTRVDSAGDLVRLEDQDRSQWDREQIAEAQRLVERALLSRRYGTFTLQAAIVAVHVEAPTSAATDWRQIVMLYDVLARRDSSKVVALNRAVAIGMRDGPHAGVAAVSDVMHGGELASYHLAHAALADFQRRIGLRDAALASYRRALELCRQDAERRFLERRIAALE